MKYFRELQRSQPPRFRVLPLTALRSLTLCAAILTSLLASCSPVNDLLTAVEALCGQSTFSVTTTEEGSDPEQLCSPGQECTLRAALNSAAFCGGSPRTVVLARGAVYTLRNVNTPPGALRSREEAQIRRVGHAGLPRIFGTVTIEGNNATIQRDAGASSSFRLFHVPARGNLTLRNVVLRQGVVPPLGSSPAAAAFGGALYNEGIFTAIATRFENNLAGSGGALFNDGNATIEQSTFSSNKGHNAGGGIWATGGALTIRRSTFQGQTSGYGTGSTGALYCRSTLVRLEDVTIAGNESSDSEFGIGGVRAASGCEITFSNTIVAKNAPSDCWFGTSRPVDRQGDNLASDLSCGFSVTGDPNLGPLVDNGGPTQTMLPGSGPALDAGSHCLPADQRGFLRPVGACDIGAVERSLIDDRVMVGATSPER